MLLLHDQDDDAYDAKVATFVISMFVASFDATASALAAVVNFLADLPHIYEEVLKGIKISLKKMSIHNDMILFSSHL